jgi:hypothetical protein
MRLRDRIESTTQFWKLILPNVPPPPPYWLGILCSHSDEVIEEAIVTAGKKFSMDRFGENVTATDVWRYVSGTARGINARANSTIAPSARSTEPCTTT